MLFKDRIKEEISHRDMSISELASATGLSRYKLQKMLDGGEPNPKDMEIVCEFLCFSPDEVTFDDLNISVEECANIMHKSQSFVKAMVRNGVFGYCQGSNYHIPRLKFEQYMGLKASCDLNEMSRQLLMLCAEQMQKVGKKLA